MDEMRAMLDQLMGQDRDLPQAEREKRRPIKKHFSDRDICKYYLCGFCPYEEFRRTKNDFGDCPAKHDEACRMEWEALSDREKERYDYERDLLRWMERLQNDLRKRIEANTVRLAATQKPAFLAEDKTAMESIDKEIAALLAKAAELGEQGEVDAAEAATMEADGLRIRKKELERQADARSGNASRGLVQSVCPVSGLIINDEESRLRDHHTGRNYNAWKKLHAMYTALDEKLSKRRGGGGGGGRGDYRRHRDRDGDRGRPRRRSRSYERRHRSRSRSASRGRSRSGERSRRRRDYSPKARRDNGHGDGRAPREARLERAPSPEEGEVGIA